jgi:hypothetical protein
MTPPLLLAAVPGAAVALGLLLVVAGWRRTLPETDGDAAVPLPQRAWRWLRSPGRTSRAWDEVRGRGWAEWRWVVALQAGLLTWLLSGWPVAGAGVWAGVIGVPVLLGAGRTARAAIERAEAVEGWSRRLADVLLTGAGLEQAVAATVSACPDLVRPQVTALAARWRPLDRIPGRAACVRPSRCLLLADRHGAAAGQAAA